MGRLTICTSRKATSCSPPKKRIEEEVEEVVEFARKSPYPKPEEALENVFIGGN